MTTEEQFGEYLFSIDKHKLQPERIHRYLSCESYWAKGISMQTVIASINGSTCFGIYYKHEQIGFARIISDGATFAYLADVYITEPHRKKGLSKHLMRFIINKLSLQNLRRVMLATKDAHGLYRQFGFKPIEEPERLMELKPQKVNGVTDESANAANA